MNKKVNTVFFIIGATVFNVLVIFLIYFGCIYLFAVFYNDSMADYVELANTLFFFVSIIGGFLIYRLVLKILSKKIDMDKYFEPILTKKK